jgi:internalin A
MQVNPSGSEKLPPQQPTLHWPAGPGDWDAVDAIQVRRIIIGRLKGESGPDAVKGARAQETAGTSALPKNFAASFTALTHLYLWNLDWLRELPELPESLQCLDVRACTTLTGLKNLPALLETLVLDACPRLTLTTAQLPKCFVALDDLSLREAEGLEQALLDTLLQRCPVLRKLDLSGCQWLRRITMWPAGLVDLRLRGCKGLSGLPAQGWPSELRRLDLNGAEAITALPPFGPKLDYIDLSGTAALHAVPIQALGEVTHWPSTLFLHQSGIRVPPASEHGSAGENVASRVREHFRLRALTGVGTVRRCKVLVLGNGSAGKTCLSLRLVPGHDPPKECQALGSTHGVQFFVWPHHASIGGAVHPVQLHLWDFGGQEIYHNTHRIFMSTGSVFLVLWNPDQEGKTPPPGQLGFQDRWRSLRYWLDLIRLERPQGARIAVVCSYEDADEPQDLERPKGSHGRPHCTLAEAREFRHAFEAQLEPHEREAIKFCCIDAWNGLGEIEDLKHWLEEEVGEEITAAGQEVPACWEPAQDLVESWLERMDKDQSFAQMHRVLTHEQFSEALRAAIEAAIAAPRGAVHTGTDYSKLAEAIRSGAFKPEDAVDGILRFLTRSGWLFWDERLHSRRVIVGQQWALEGIYAILDRNAFSPVHQKLVKRNGVFTRSSLAAIERFIWNDRYSPDDQHLLLSFMERCGLCFKLRDAQHAGWREDVFVSTEHLQPGEALLRKFRARAASATAHDATIRCDRVHRLHWQAILVEVGRKYGANAEYAQDAVVLQNAEGQWVLIDFAPDDSGFGGEVRIKVTGSEAPGKDRSDQVVGWLCACLPMERLGIHSARGEQTIEALGGEVQVVQVFISYTWDVPERVRGPHTPPPYEEPVDAIARFLERENARAAAAKRTGERLVRFDLRRDKVEVRFGDSISQFMAQLGSCDSVIVVHSDKFCRSPYCMYELHELHNGPRNVPRAIEQWIIPVEHVYVHQSQRVASVTGADHWAREWRRHPGHVPHCWRSLDELLDHASSAIRWFGELTDDCKGVNIRWTGDADADCQTILARLKSIADAGDTRVSRARRQ